MLHIVEAAVIRLIQVLIKYDVIAVTVNNARADSNTFLQTDAVSFAPAGVRSRWRLLLA